MVKIAFVVLCDGVDGGSKNNLTLWNTVREWRYCYCLDFLHTIIIMESVLLGWDKCQVVIYQCCLFISIQCQYSLIYRSYYLLIMYTLMSIVSKMLILSGVATIWIKYYLMLLLWIMLDVITTIWCLQYSVYCYGSSCVLLYIVRNIIISNVMQE